MMKYKPNFFVRFADDDDELNRQNGDSKNNKKNGSGFKNNKLTKNLKSDSVQKSWQQNLIINPDSSEWLNIWDFIMDVALMYGYIFDPYFIAFYIAHGNNAKPDV